MDQETPDTSPRKAETMGPVPATKKVATPGWASGLRQLYESVVDEELPDNFKDLLSKLDAKS